MNQQITVNGVPLNVHDEGTGAPILFVHGFPLDGSMWRHQLDRFRTFHRLIAPDLRGFGRSGATEGTVSMEQFADDLAALLDELRVDEPVTLCGLSMGGYVAWQFFLRHREKLSRLILCDTKGAADSPQARLARYESADRVLADGPGFLAESMPEKLFSERTRTALPEVVAEAQQVIRRTSPVGIAAALRGMAERPDVTERLGEIDVPTLLVVGVDDLMTTVEEMRALAAAIPSARFEVIPEAGHMAPLENPSEVNGAIDAFVSETSVADGK